MKRFADTMLNLGCVFLPIAVGYALGRFVRWVVLLVTVGICAGCPSGDPPTANSCESPIIHRGVACPQEVRDWTRIQGAGPAEPQAISNANGGFDYAVIEAGTCVYADACGVAYRIQGCYLGDGYVCP